MQPRAVAEKFFFHATNLELRTEESLPDGVCGRLSGVAFMYNTADDYGTMFAPGCIDKTRAEKVNKGKVKLFADHGPFTDTHVGVVRSIEDMGDAAVMTADLFDTEPGRAMKDYLVAVLKSGADTGISISGRARRIGSRQRTGIPTSCSRRSSCASVRSRRCRPCRAQT